MLCHAGAPCYRQPSRAHSGPDLAEPEPSSSVWQLAVEGASDCPAIAVGVCAERGAARPALRGPSSLRTEPVIWPVAMALRIGQATEAGRLRPPALTVSDIAHEPTVRRIGSPIAPETLLLR